MWRILEARTRQLAMEAKRVHVVCGPLFLPTTKTEDGRRFIKFEVLGESCIAVPTHFFKALQIEHRDGRREFRAWVIPNGPEVLGREFEEFEVSQDVLESWSGVRLFYLG